MPIHLRAQPGDYAPAVLCPGDPRRAEYIARTFFDKARLVNEERGMLGYTGTCGALQPHMEMADVVVAMAATPSDRTVFTYTGGEPHAPVADWRLVSLAARLALEQGENVHVGAIVSSDVFYDPDVDRPRRWAQRGHLGIEMEASVLYTIAALRGIAALTVLTVSDVLYGEAPIRISDDELRQGVDRMIALAARVATTEL